MAGKPRTYIPTDELDAKMWRQYSHYKTCLKNDNLARYDANGNRILMKLSYEEWKNIWLSSGKYHLRGRKAGCYVMSRNNDIGHYEIGNVEIVSIAVNQNIAHKGRKAAETTKQLMSAGRTKEKHPLWGKKHKPETIQKLSLAAKNRKRKKEDTLCPTV